MVSSNVTCCPGPCRQRTVCATRARSIGVWLLAQDIAAVGLLMHMSAAHDAELFYAALQ